MMIQNSTDPRYIVFTVPGEVRGQGRPRTQIINSKDGKSYAHIYQTNKDIDAKHNIQLYAKDALARKSYVMAGPDGMGISVMVKIFVKVPRSFSKKKTEAALAGEILPQRKPDLDNVLKSVLDAMNGVVYRDDKEVTKTAVARYYAESDYLAVKVSWNERGEAL